MGIYHEVYGQAQQTSKSVHLPHADGPVSLVLLELDSGADPAKNVNVPFFGKNFPFLVGSAGWIQL